MIDYLYDNYEKKLSEKKFEYISNLRTLYKIKKIIESYLKLNNKFNYIKFFEIEASPLIVSFNRIYRKNFENLYKNKNLSISFNELRKFEFKCHENIINSPNKQLEIINYLSYFLNKKSISKVPDKPKLKTVKTKINLFIIKIFSLVILKKIFRKIKKLIIVNQFIKFKKRKALLINSKNINLNSLFEVDLQFYDYKYLIVNGFQKNIILNYLEKIENTNNIFKSIQNKLLIIYLIQNIKNYIFEDSFYKKNISKITYFLNKENFKFIVFNGGAHKIENLLMLYSAKNLSLKSIYVQSGGIPLHYSGMHSDFNNYSDLNLDLFDSIFFYSKNNNLNFHKKYKRISPYPYFNVKAKKNNIFYKKKKIRLLFSPLCLSEYIFNISLNLSIHCDEFIKHNSFIIEMFSVLNEFVNIEFEILIKTKTPKYYYGFEFLLFPNLKNLNVNYISKFDAIDYFDYFDIYITSSSSTSLLNALSTNIPVICLYDKSSFIQDNNYKDIINDLIDAKIIATNQTEFKNSVYEIINDQWNSIKKQKVKNKYKTIFYSN